MPNKKLGKRDELNLDNPLVIQLIKKLLEKSAIDQDKLFAKLDEAQKPSQIFLRETEFTI